MIAGPAIALLELESIARGMIVADAVVKRAKVSLHRAEPVTPGKYLLLFHGPEAHVEESFQAGVEAAGSTLLDKLYLPRAADGLRDALDGGFEPGWEESIGVVETHTVASALLACDTALKRAEVRLIQLHLARGIGGKGYFVLTGALDMVQAALEGAAGAVDPSLLQAVEILEAPHPELGGRVF
ncbi:MAG: BMC domain-containing protein [Myxococcaceae bacterium]|nr:BMC domain-containing protein [Myxococcaceae bacterium]